MRRNVNRNPSRGRWLMLLLIIPLIAMLYPPFYAKWDPSWAGIPFFYWYQFLWVAISVVITAVVYRLVARE